MTLTGIRRLADAAPSRVASMISFESVWFFINAEQAPWLLVGHMPLVGALSARLADGDPRGCLPMPTGAIVALEAEVWAAGCAEWIRVRYPAELDR